MQDTRPQLQFSIITVTRNNLAGLQSTYGSVAKQKLRNFEWIIIDGASTDGSLDFLKEISGQGLRMSAISEPDTGIYDAMNKGIKRARGNYVLFLNAGDKLSHPAILEKMELRAKKDPDFIWGDALEPHKDPKQKPLYKNARPYRELEWGMMTHHQSMLYRRQIIRDHKLHYRPIYEIAADYDFTIRFLQKSKKIAYVPLPVCIFEQGGISQQKAFQGRREQYVIREELNMVSTPRNVWIFIVQTLAWQLRTRAPWLYALLKYNKPIKNEPFKNGTRATK